MNVKFAVRTRIVVNTKKYNRAEEMPPEVREALEKAVSSKAQPGQPGSTIILNGRAYDSPESMSPEDRKLYDEALRVLPTAPQAEPPLQASAETATGPIEPTTTPRWLLIQLFLGALLIVWYFAQGRG